MLSCHDLRVARYDLLRQAAPPEDVVGIPQGEFGVGFDPLPRERGAESAQRLLRGDVVSDSGDVPLTGAGYDGDDAPDSETEEGQEGVAHSFWDRRGSWCKKNSDAATVTLRQQR